MTDSKIAQRHTPIGGDSAAGSGVDKDTTLDRHAREVIAPETRKGNSWETYRRWLTRVQAPGSGRVPLDPSLYTWKGYRNWSDKVRRDWKPED
jgi:hypothetical protein